jgi:hypothetical protein
MPEELLSPCSSRLGGTGPEVSWTRDMWTASGSVSVARNDCEIQDPSVADQREHSVQQRLQGTDAERRIAAPSLRCDEPRPSTPPRRPALRKQLLSTSCESP